jgi:hypothetical protein
MNLRKLRDAEALFLHRYPGGFEDEDLKPILRKHNVGKLTEFAATALAPERFARQSQVLDDIVKIASRSSMVSMFEKPKFRDFVGGLSRPSREQLADAYRRALHDDAAGGFEDLVAQLAEAGLAKWTLLTVCPFYYRPQQDVFVKPNTTKDVIRRFELEGLVYRPRPSWTFYQAYRSAIDEMKAAVHPSLSPSNAAFTGFLMMTAGDRGSELAAR